MPLRSPRTGRGLSHPCSHTALLSDPRGYFRVFEVAMASTQPMPSKCAAGATRARRLLLPHTAPFVPIFAAGPPGQGKKSCAREPCAFAGGGFARGKMAQPPRAMRGASGRAWSLQTDWRSRSPGASLPLRVGLLVGSLT